MKLLAVTLALVATVSVGGRSSAEPQDPTAPPVASSANSVLVDDITRLWKANLSEEFINKYFARTDLARDLTPDDVVRLRSAGVPESLIASLTHQGAAAGTVASASPVPVPVDSRRWDGLALRNSGIVLFKGRWDSGMLEFKEASLRWVDSKRTEKNLLIPASQFTEQQLTCLKKAGGNECFEWVVKTRSEEYRFRDMAWKQGENSIVQDVFDFFRSAYPNLISSRTPVDEK